MDLSPKVSASDLFEIEALGGLKPEEALALGFFHSQECMAGISPNGDVVTLFGVVPLVPRKHGSIWMLCAEDMGHSPRYIVRLAQKWVDEQQEQYELLSNTVSEQNTRHRRLLKALGFTFLEPIDNYGPGQIRVIPFERRK
jgi:ribosomal protein S18 acetylase RimI-like enzyme